MSAMTADASITARPQQPRKANSRLAIIIAIYGSLSVALYGALGWGAYRLVERFAG